METGECNNKIKNLNLRWSGFKVRENKSNRNRKKLWWVLLGIEGLTKVLAVYRVVFQCVVEQTHFFFFFFRKQHLLNIHVTK